MKLHDELNQKFRMLHVTKELFFTLLKIMWVVGGITVVGDFIIWSLWSDYELNGPIDIRMAIFWVGCGWMALWGIAAIVVLICNRVCAVKVAKSETNISAEDIDMEGILQPINKRIFWRIAVAGSLLILLVGNILCWRAVPVSADGREAIMSYVQERMPGKELEIVENSGHSYALEISGSTEHSTELFSVEFMQNEDLLDQENFSLYLSLDCRYYNAQQMMDAVKGYINAIDANVFADGDITYVSSEFGKMEEQVLARSATLEELEDYEAQVDFARAAGDTTVHFAVEDSVIDSYDGTKYKRINIRIHAINFRWDL